MSLHAIADHMASKGRGPDTMLIHMAPDEVRGLQALAMAHGGSLTINPETGLPEAGWLSKLLPAIIGAGISWMSGGTIDPMTAASIVGGVETVRTGDIGKGLQAGLGAYGGSSIYTGVSTAGGNILSGEATSAAASEAAKLAGEEAIRNGIANNFTPEMLEVAKQQAIDNAGSNVARIASDASPWDKLVAGADQAVKNPMQAVKDYAKPLLMAAGPAIAAGANIQKGMPQTLTSPTAAYHPYVYDPYGGTYDSLGTFPIEPKKAAGGGLMGMADGGYSPGMLDFTQRSEPVVRMAGGGDLKMPEGWGIAGGAYDTPEEKIAYFNKQNITPDQLLGSNQGVTQADIDWMLQHGYAGNTIAPGSNKYVENIGNFFNSNPNATYQDIQTAAQGLNQQDIINAMQQLGLSKGAQFAAFNQNIGDVANTAETYGGLKGLSSNINYWLEKNPGASAQDIRREMAKWDLTDQDFIRATGTDVNNYAAGPLTKVQNPALGASGNTAAVVNENGTITQTALGDVAINPVTGERAPTTTIQNIKDLYTAGGGNLGYVNRAPINMPEFEERFGYKTPSGSKQAYDYLTGKSPYSPVPWTLTGEVMKPYAESVLGVRMNKSTKKYLFDPETRQYKLNPDYQPPVYDPVTRLRSQGMSSNQILAGLRALPNPADDLATYNWMVANKLTPEQVAEALGPTANLALIREKYNRYATGSTTDLTNRANKPVVAPPGDNEWVWDDGSGKWVASPIQRAASGGLAALTMAGGGMSHLGSYSDGGRLLKGPGDGVSDSIPATIGHGKQPARLADGEFVVPARIVSELGNGSTEAGARKLYAMMDRIQAARRSTVGKGKVAKNSRSEKYLPA